MYRKEPRDVRISRLHIFSARNCIRLHGDCRRDFLLLEIVRFFEGDLLIRRPQVTKAQQTEKAEAIAALTEWIKPGMTIYTVLRHVSTSGMYRAIDVYLMEDNQPRYITWTVSKACGFTYNRKHEAIGIGGCGMDMGFSIVYDLARTLFRNGFDCVGRGCPSNDHSNGDRNYEPHRHTGDGGYALHQRWL
jgi:hypothetical protein